MLKYLIRNAAAFNHGINSATARDRRTDEVTECLSGTLQVGHSVLGRFVESSVKFIALKISHQVNVESRRAGVPAALDRSRMTAKAGV
jgi:hypothetical protein